MQRVRVKIEGLLDPADAVRAARMGADAIGMVFADSPRRIEPVAARAITDALPPWVATVGVFVNEDADTINRTVEAAGIDYVQLHGDERPEIVPQIRARCIKAFRVRDEGWLAEVRAWGEGCRRGVAGMQGMQEMGDGDEEETKTSRASPASLPSFGAVRRPAGVLVDAYDPKARGGTGRRFNWDLVGRAREAGELGGIEPIILAGGLTPECVGEAIGVVQPWAVDVASGVETAPGVKDFDKIAAFLRAVAQA